MSEPNSGHGGRTARLERQLVALLERLTVLEDERAIRAALVSYGFAVDNGDSDGAAALYTHDCSIEVENGGRFDGRAGVAEIVGGVGHQKLLPNCAHIMSPVVIEVNEASAVATGYAVVLLRTGGNADWQRDDFTVYYAGTSRYELTRQNGRWLVTRRIVIPLGSKESQELLARGMLSHGAD